MFMFIFMMFYSSVVFKNNNLKKYICNPFRLFLIRYEKKKL